MDLLSNYDFDLPEELIATRARTDRVSSRLMVLRKKDRTPVHDQFVHLIDYLHEGDVLVLNNTKVMHARIDAYKKTGGKIELLLVRPTSRGGWASLISGKGPFRPGTKFYLGTKESKQSITIENKYTDEQGLYEISSSLDLAHYIETHGELPLPPYFRRKAEPEDYQRYQTVYAKSSGAVAAPTAGLHFTERYLQMLMQKGIRVVEITLHVGPGTFLPIRTDTISAHKMHTEFFAFSEHAAATLNDARLRKARIIPVGTTSMRVIEQVMASAYAQGRREFFACEGSTALFIRPGFLFLASDALVTNFHIPRSTLLLLVAAVSGRERILRAYQEAIDRGYRFFSYGDASFLEICR